MKNGNIGVKLSPDGKVLVLPMNHKRRIELINFLLYCYLDELDIDKRVAKDIFKDCYLVVISDLSKNELHNKLNL